jgi:ribosomal protein L31
MKENILLYLINYHCISCQAEYQDYSMTKENKKINICANCNPAYKGEASTEIRIGRAEKFYQRQQKAQAKAKERKK